MVWTRDTGGCRWWCCLDVGIMSKFSCPWVRPAGEDGVFSRWDEAGRVHPDGICRYAGAFNPDYPDHVVCRVCPVEFSGYDGYTCPCAHCKNLRRYNGLSVVVRREKLRRAYLTKSMLDYLREWAGRHKAQMRVEEKHLIMRAGIRDWFKNKTHTEMMEMLNSYQALMEDVRKGKAQLYGKSRHLMLHARP